MTVFKIWFGRAQRPPTRSVGAEGEPFPSNHKYNNPKTTKLAATRTNFVAAICVGGIGEVSDPPFLINQLYIPFARVLRRSNDLRWEDSGAAENPGPDLVQGRITDFTLVCSSNITPTTSNKSAKTSRGNF